MHRAMTFVAATGTAIVAAVATTTAPARAQGSRIITCESYNHQLRVCGIPQGSRVRIVQRLSAADCRQNSTWGVDHDHIWVDRGCRARFEVSRGYGGRDGGSHGHDYPGGRGRYDDDHGGYGRGGSHGVRTPPGQRERAQNGELGRARDACLLQARAAHLSVSRIGDWSRGHGGVVYLDMWVHGRGVERRARCEYDPHRRNAELHWLR
jgi:hypothetical protein